MSFLSLRLMNRTFRLILSAFLSVLCGTFPLFAQTSRPQVVGHASTAVEHWIDLAAKGQCKEALPELKKAVLQVSGKQVRYIDTKSSWLGAEAHEVPVDRARELKLLTGRGVLIAKVIPDSPADKAGLKENDVVLTTDGQPVEGTA